MNILCDFYKNDYNHIVFTKCISRGERCIHPVKTPTGIEYLYGEAIFKELSNSSSEIPDHFQQYNVHLKFYKENQELYESILRFNYNDRKYEILDLEKNTNKAIEKRNKEYVGKDFISKCRFCFIINNNEIVIEEYIHKCGHNESKIYQILDDIIERNLDFNGFTSNSILANFTYNNNEYILSNISDSKGYYIIINGKLHFKSRSEIGNILHELGIHLSEYPAFYYHLHLEKEDIPIALRRYTNSTKKTINKCSYKSLKKLRKRLKKI